MPNAWPAVALGGGVAANGPLRKAVATLCEERGIPFKEVSRELCTDNAAMIGSAARFVDPPRLSGLPRIRCLRHRTARRPVKVTVLTRSGCHLCDEAVADLERYRSSGSPKGEALEIEERNIESDEDLHRRYMERIPVIMIGERNHQRVRL